VAAEAASTNKSLDRLATWVCVGLVLAISYVLVKIIFFTLDPQVSAIVPSIYGDTNQVGVVAKRPADKTSVDPSAIPLWNLFGKVGVQKKTTTVEDVVAPTTRLKLVLMGVFAHKDEDRSTAIISEQRKPGKLFHIGDKVPGNATLAAVYEDRVLLNTRGKLETLYFSKTKTASKSSRSSSSKSSRSSKSTRSSRTSRSSGANKASGISKMMRGGPSSPGQIASIIGEELGQNAVGALKELGLEQNNGNGYKISNGSNPLFSALGVKPGDVILSVNGMSIGDPETDIKAIPEALEGTGGSCTIDIQQSSGRQFSQTFPCGGL